MSNVCRFKDYGASELRVRLVTEFDFHSTSPISSLILNMLLKGQWIAQVSASRGLKSSHFGPKWKYCKLCKMLFKQEGTRCPCCKAPLMIVEKPRCAECGKKLNTIVREFNLDNMRLFYGHLGRLACSSTLQFIDDYQMDTPPPLSSGC